MNSTTKKLQLSVMMFIQFFIWGAWYVTMGTYLGQTLNFSGVQIGLAYGTAAIASMISPFIVGMIADRFFSANHVMAFLNLVGAGLLFWLTQIKEFSLFFPVLFAYTICYMPTTALCNSISFENLKDPGKEFSRIRLLGSIGWIAAGVLVSFLNVEHLATPFFIAGVSSVLGVGLALLLPYKKPERSKEKISFFKMLGFDAFKLTKERSFTILLLFSALTCIPLAFYDSFTNLYLNDFGIKNAAAAMSLGQIAEIVFLFTFPFFFAKLRYKGSIGIAIFVWMSLYGFFALAASTGVSAFIYAALPLHGFCFTFFFVSGQLFVDEKAPSNLRNSAQGLIAFATYGVGKYLGTLVAGNVVDNFSTASSYNWVAIWTAPLIMITIIFVGFMLCFKENKTT
ncbi:MFS transporter [Massilibacteroides vaginae]|uniref:MFS transporter n=1 Tax=Massilibacteroides vaginae TaxID=1673718 RepID=UPI000A1CACCD|nr:MFS transporter [Massilibacteroides vaginae]